MPLSRHLLAPLRRPVPGSALLERCLYGLPQGDRATTPPPAGRLITAPVFLTPSSPAPSIHNIIKPSHIHEAVGWWSVCLGGWGGGVGGLPVTLCAGCGNGAVVGKVQLETVGG